MFVKYVRWFLQEGLAPINLIVEDKFHRATPGGTGSVKTIGNYASVILLYFIVVQVMEATGLLFLDLCSLILLLLTSKRDNFVLKIFKGKEHAKELIE